MAGHKRKADNAVATSESPSKKPATDKIKINYQELPDAARPILMTSSGFTVPSDIKFARYVKFNSDGTSNLLLQSSDHPTIDYVATESKLTEAAEQHVRHCVGLFDPETNTLNIMEARKMTCRSIVRVPDASDDDEEEEARVPATPSTRTALTQAFGTKKSKKAVASIAENRLLARDARADDAISSAILGSIKDQEDEEEEEEIDGATTARDNKPLPKANLHTDDITQVYPLSTLVVPGPYQTTLSQMPIAFWKDRVSKNKPIASSSRFIATRVSYLTSKHLKDPDNDDVREKLQVLRYNQLLLEIHKYISHQHGRKSLAPVEKWPQGTTTDSSLSTNFKARLISHFFPTGVPTASAKTLLVATILALTLYIPPPKTTSPQPSMLFTEPSEITLDLAIPHAEIHKLYRELGCKSESMTDSELNKSGWDKVAPPREKVDPETGKMVKTPKPKFMKLKFPIEFPKLSTGRPAARR